MAATLLKIHPKNPESRKINTVVDCIRDGGVVIYPTDTVYGIGCDIHQARAVERISKIKGLDPRKYLFSFICHDLSHIAEYASVEDQVFKIMKKALPGAFTFILKASNKVPKVLNNNRKTVGIRIPEHNIPRMIVAELGNPFLSTSLKEEDNAIEYSTDPELIYERYQHEVDLVVDGGIGGYLPSTIVDCSQGEIVVVRSGLGDFTPFL
ncbi:MAG: threonylcarbamoyl-AMP synthase [Cytophagales bacterium]|nr:MAG: threonylcarbamoyl-AMP synthase [Cytophagales bacterium]